jgi:hypothetical protein
MKVIILTSQDGDWEGLFINGNLIDEGHTLGEGDRAYLLEKSEEYGFTSKDIGGGEVNDEDNEYLMQFGGFPGGLSDLKGSYE